LANIGVFATVVIVEEIVTLIKKNVGKTWLYASVCKTCRQMLSSSVSQMVFLLFSADIIHDSSRADFTTVKTQRPQRQCLLSLSAYYLGP
jgi:hypothetical protein